MKLTALVGAVMVMLSVTTAIQAGTAAAALPTDAALGLKLDGNLESAYASNFAAIEYSRDSGQQFSGQISVIETEEAYWVGFVQAFNAKSNNYCGGNSAQCKTDKAPSFNSLVGSDFIGFSWPGLGVSGGSNQTPCIAVGILYEAANGQWASGPLDNDGGRFGKECPGRPLGGNKGDPTIYMNGFPLGSIDAKSAMEWNMSPTGANWTDEENSPNYAGQPDHPYIYPSIAEVRIDKAKSGVAAGQTDKVADAFVLVHNSPEGNVTGGRQLIGIVCTGSGTAQVGETATFPITVSLDGTPPGTPQKVIARITGPGEVVSVGGQPGSAGPTNANGVANIVVRATATGTINVGAVWDLNGNGTYEPATEPVTVTTCPLVVADVNNTISVEVTKTNDANVDTTFSKDETAKSVGQSVEFRSVVTNTSTVPVKILSFTDEWAGRAAFTPTSCNSLIGTVLAAGQSAPACTFTVTNYSPAAGSALENTVRTQVEEESKPGNTADAFSTSIVRSPFTPPNPPELKFELNKVNDANGNGTYTKSEIAPAPGATVPFRVTIKNTTTVPETITKITDEWPGTAAFTPGGTCGPLVGTKVLAPNEEITCEFSQANYAPPAGQTLINTVVVTVSETANPANTLTKSSTSAVTTPLTPPNPPELKFELNKVNDANGNGTYTKSETAPAAGASVPFRVTIKNTSTVAEKIVELTDEWPGRAAFTPGGTCGPLVGTKVLAPNEEITCEFTQANYAPPAGTSLINTVVVTVQENTDPSNTLTKSSTSAVNTQFTPPNPPVITITIDKTNDGNGNGTFTKSEVAPAAGATVPFRAVITNTSAVAITLDSLTDQWPGRAEFGVCANLIGTTLAAGASTTCNFSQSNYAPAAGSSLTNTVIVTGSEVGNPANKATASSNSTVTTPTTPPNPPQISVTIDKTNNADGQGGFSKSETAPAPQADVPFRAIFTNTSNVAVKVDSLTDQWPGKAPFDVCNSAVGTTLQPGASVTCNFTVLDYAPAAGSSLTNTVIVTVSEATNPANKATASSNSTVNTVLQPPPGITFTLNKLNDANGNGTFTKSEQAPAAGATVPFQVAITNTSTVPVVITAFTDQWPGTNPFTPAGTCGPLVGTSLAPGETKTCTFSQSNYAPAAGSSLINTVVVTVVQQGNPTNTATNSSQSTVTTPLTPPQAPNITMTVDKLNDANGNGTFTKAEQAPAAGASVPFQVTITNTSSVPVVVSAITDQWPGTNPFTPAGTCGPLVGTKVLAAKGTAGDSVTCTFTQANYAPASGSTLINTVIATVVEQGNPTNTATSSSTSTVSTGITPPQTPNITMTVNKTNDANGDGTFNKSETAPVPGAPVPFKALVTNTSSVDVVLTVLTDTLPGEQPVPICPNLIGSTLAAGASVTCDFTRPAPASGSSITDTVTSTVTEVGNPSNTATSTSQSTVNTLPVITATITKTNDGNGDGTFTDNETASAPGAPVPYRAVITNTSAVAVALTALTDVFPGQAPVGICPELLNTVLAPGASVTCNFTAPAPAVGPDVTDTVQATLVDVGNPNNSTTVQDVSTVRTVQVLPLVLTQPPAAPPAPAALPMTGANSSRGMSLAMAIFGAGLLLVGVAGLRRPRWNLTNG